MNVCAGTLSTAPAAWMKGPSLPQKIPSEEEAITRVVVRMNATMTGIVIGLLLGIGLFLATLWLVIKGGPNPGPHLALLGQYFPGYSVSFLGALIGFAYALALGFATGFILGNLYNRLAK